MNKKVSIGTRPSAAIAPSAEATDAWVEKRGPVALKRLTFDIDAALHARMKVECARRGVSMVDELGIRFLTRQVPATRVRRMPPADRAGRTAGLAQARAAARRMLGSAIAPRCRARTPSIEVSAALAQIARQQV